MDIELLKSMKAEYEARLIKESNVDLAHVYYKRVLILGGIIHNLPPERIAKHLDRAHDNFVWVHGREPIENKA